MHALHFYYSHLHGVSVLILTMTVKVKPADWNIFSVFVATVLGVMILSAKALRTQPYKKLTLSINNTQSW